MGNAILMIVAAVLLLTSANAARFSSGGNISEAHVQDVFGSIPSTPLIMDLLHIHHPSSPFKVKNATPEEEAQALIERTEAYVRRLARRIADDNSSAHAVGEGQEQLYGPPSNPQASSLLGPHGTFFTQMLVGTPGTLNAFLIDTDSDITWVQCLPCTNCFPQSDGPQGPVPYFDNTLSSTFARVSCNTRDCFELPFISCNPTGPCTYRAPYSYPVKDGFSAGDLARETFTIGNFHKITEYVFGCSHDTNLDFNYGSGLIGLGAGPLSVVAQLKTGLFFCLPKTKQGFVGLGHVPAAPNTLFTNLLKSSRDISGYYVPLSAISVNGVGIPLPLLEPEGVGGTVIGTGSTATIVHSDAYNTLRNALRDAAAAAQFPPLLDGISTFFDSCYPANPQDLRPPSVALHFADGQSLPLPSENIMVPQPGGACFSFVSSEIYDLPKTVLGANQLQGFLVTIDPPSNTVSFAPAGCL